MSRLIEAGKPPVGGNGKGHRRPGARERVEPRRDHRVHAGAAGALQVSDVGRLRERAATEPVGQIAQARAARAVLEGPRSEDSL